MCWTAELTCSRKPRTRTQIRVGAEYPGIVTWIMGLISNNLFGKLREQESRACQYVDRYTSFSLPLMLQSINSSPCMIVPCVLWRGVEPAQCPTQRITRATRVSNTSAGLKAIARKLVDNVERDMRGASSADRHQSKAFRVGTPPVQITSLRQEAVGNRSNLCFTANPHNNQAFTRCVQMYRFCRLQLLAVPPITPLTCTETKHAVLGSVRQQITHTRVLTRITFPTIIAAARAA